MNILSRAVRAALGSDQHRFLQFSGRFGCIHAATSHAVWNDLPGDYLEFGVWRGESFAEAYHSFRFHDQERTLSLRSAGGIVHPVDRRFVAFDSFEGLPPAAEPVHADYQSGSYACSLPEFEQQLVHAGVESRDVVIVPGFYDLSLRADVRHRHRLQAASVVMIDCDLYESTVPVLEFVTPLLQQGTILIFDDWFRFRGSRHHGERRACIEWLQRNPGVELEDWCQEGPQCKAFLVHTSGAANPGGTS